MERSSRRATIQPTLWDTSRASVRMVEMANPGEDIDNWSFSSLQEVVGRYKRHIDKKQSIGNKSSNPYEDRATAMADEDTPVQARSKRRPSVQKKLDMAFAEAKGEKQKLTVHYL